MAKKTSGVSFAEALGGGLQPISTNNEPEILKPYTPGDNEENSNFDEDKVREKLKFKLANPSPGIPTQEITESNITGKYFKGSPGDSSQRSIMGENQPWINKLVGGAAGHSLSVLSKFGTGVGEVTGGAYDLVTNLIPGVAEERKEERGSAFPHMYENFLTKGFKYLEEDLMQEKLFPVYSNQKDFSGNLFTRMGSMKFWSSDLADAIAFAASAAIPVGGFTKAAKALGWGKEIMKDGKKVFDLSTKGKMFVTSGTAIWNTEMEAALEAKQQLDTIREDLSYKDFGTTYDMLTDEQRQSVNQIAGKHAANVFNANAAILLGPNLIQARFFAGPVKTTSQKLMKAVRLGKLDPNDISMFKKTLAQAGTGVLSEGLWEEGMQNAVQNYESSLAKGDEYLKRGPGYFYEWLSGFNSTEGQQSMALGAIVGMGMGARAGVLETNETKAKLGDYKTKYDKLIKETLPAADKLFASDIKHPFKTFQKEITDKDGKKKTITSILNDQGETEFDMDKVLRMYNSDMFDKSILDNLRMAVLNDDPVHEKYILNTALAKLFESYASNGTFENIDEAFEMLESRNPLKSLSEDETLKDAGFDYDYMQNKLSEMKSLWKETQDALRDREDLENNDQEYLKFRKNVEKADFYNRVKLSWLNDIRSDVKDASQLEAIEKDARESLDVFENKKSRSELYKEYQKQFEDRLSINEQYQNELRKDPKSAETKKLAYLREESKLIYGAVPEHDRFTINRKIQEKTKERGLLNEHYYNIGADAITSVRFESAKNRISEGRGKLSEIANILENPVNQSVTTRGKYDITEQDINEAVKLIPIAERTMKEQEYTLQDMQGEIGAMEKKILEGEEDMTMEEEEELKQRTRKEAQTKYDESEARRQEFESARDRINNLQAVSTGPGLTSYKSGIEKGENVNDSLERNIADEPVKDAENIASIVQSNPDSYNNLAHVKDVIGKLEDLKEIYEKTDLSDRLKKKAFKGFIDSLDRSLAKLKDNVYKTVEKNYNEKQKVDRQNQVNRNHKRFLALGLIFDENGGITIVNRELYNKLEDVIGSIELKKVLDQAKEAAEVGEEYLFHEVFTDKIISLIKKSKKKDEFIKLLEKSYDASKEEFLKAYDSAVTNSLEGASQVNESTYEQYRINPKKVFKDLILSNIGYKDESLIRKTSIDRFKNNNDPIELYENLQLEENTGYSGYQKDRLLGLVQKQFEVESSQELLDALNSAFSLEDQVKYEKELFAETKIAPTNQQVNAVRQAVKWFMGKLPEVNSKEKTMHRLKNWLFIRGNAGVGKTQVVIRYVIKSIGLKSSEVQFLAPHENSRMMLDRQNLSTVKTELISELTAIPDDVKLVIVDEIAALNDPDFIKLAEKLQEINDKRKTPFRVISLGDPNQVSAQEKNSTVTVTPAINKTGLYGTEYITVADPLTIKHRSLVPEINEVLDIFEDNINEVRNIPVYASGQIGFESIGIHAGDMAGLEKMIGVHKDNGKSKVIVVATQNEKLRMQNQFPALKDSVFTFTEVAGTEFDEVYVALSEDQFKDVAEFNKAYYTAASRTRQYVYLLDKTGTFKSLVKTSMEKDYADGGAYAREKEKMLEERRKNLTTRHDVETQVMAGTKITLTKEEKTEQVNKEEEKIVRDKEPGTDVADLYAEEESEDANEEEDSTENSQAISVVNVETDKEHNLKYPSYIGAVYMPKNGNTKDSLRPSLKAGGEVIYVKAEDKNGNAENGATVYVLGQLYNSEGVPIDNQYAVLGIMGNEEFYSDLGKEINDRVVNGYSRNEEGESLFNKVNVNSDGVATLGIKNPEVLNKTILIKGKISNVTPLSYTYAKGGSPTFAGEGFIDKLYSFLNLKLFKRSDEEISYQIKIYTPGTLAKDQELAKKNLSAGVPYLLVSRRRKTGSTQSTQFVRLNPSNLARTNKNFVELKAFYDSLEIIEDAAKAKLGEAKFNEMIQHFSKNYHLNGSSVEFDRRNLTYAEYNRKAVSGYVPVLTRNQFKKIEENITPVIIGIYGEGKKRVRIESEAAMIEKYKLDKDNVAEGVKYTFKQKEGESFGYVIESNAKDPNDKGDYKYEPTLRAGAGTAQTALNIIAKANREVGGKPIRVQRLIRRNTAGKLQRGRYISAAKSLLTTKDSNEGYYSALRKVMHKAGEKQLEVEELPDMMFNTREKSYWVDKDNVKEVEEIIIKKGYLTQGELDQIRHEYDVDPITSDTIRSIVTFEGERHPSLRTPLIMEQINSWGENNRSIDDNKGKIEEVLQSSLEDIISTKVSVSTPFNTARYDENGEAQVDKINKDGTEDQDIIKRSREAARKILNRGKKLRDTFQPFLAREKVVSERSIRRAIKRMIPDITDDQIKFMEKTRVDALAGERAWGLFKDGIIYISTYSKGGTYQLIARHEVFHKIFTEYLTPKQQRKVEEMARKEWPGEIEKYETIEELLATKFQEYQRGTLKKISEFFKSLFDEIMKLIGLYSKRIDSIDDLFYKINNGLIDNRRSKADNSTRLMKEIVARFGSIDMYLKNIDIILDNFAYYRTHGINGIYSTHEEIRAHVMESLKAMKLDAELAYKETGEIVHLEESKIYGNIITNYNDLLKDVFPGFNNYKGGIYQSNLSQDIKDEVIKEKQTVNNNKHIIENVYTNTELDITNEVKELLSYIRGEDGDFLSWRYVYVKLLDMFEGLAFEQKDKSGKYLIKEQLSEGFKGKELTANEKTILNFVTGLYENIESSVTESGTKITKHGKYLANGMFIFADKAVDHIKHESDTEIRDGSVKVVRKFTNETSVEFASRIKNVSGINNKTLFELSKRQYYNEMFNRLVNHFNSHRQRDPKIGERKVSYGSYEIRYFNARGSAVSNGIKDRINYMIGNKIKTEKDVMQLIDKIKEWDNKVGMNNDLGFVKEFMNYIGLYQYSGSLTTYNAKQIRQDINHVFPAIVGIIGKPLSKEDGNEAYLDETVDAEREDTPEATYTAEYLISQYHNSFLNHMTEAVSLLDNLSRILSSSDAAGKRRYNAVLTSGAHKKLYNLVHAKFGSKITGYNHLQLDETFRSPFFKNNIFIKGLNRIFSVIDDDGLRYDTWSGEQYSVMYKNEKREDYNFRQFVLGFLTTIKHSTEKHPRYIQYLYPSERKTPFGVEVNVLGREKLLETIETTLKQIDSRDKENEKKYTNYKADSHIGFAILDEVLNGRTIGEKSSKKNKTVSYSDLALEIYNKLDEKSHQLTEDIIYDRTAFDSDFPITEKFDNIIDRTLYPGFTVKLIPKNKSGHLKMLETSEEFNQRNKDNNVDWSTAWDKGEEKKYLLAKDNLQPLVSAYFINDYVNGYHASQLVAGDFAAFKNTVDISRRITIALAPGKTGLVHDRYGMNRYARVAVIEDPVKDNKTVGDFIKSLIPDIKQQDLDDLMKHYPKDGFKPGDGQAFILPERLEDINYGFGEDYGRVLKPVYYHIEEDGSARALKYSSIVLSDDLVSQHPALRVLRDKMRGNMIDGKPAPIDEVVFASGVKVGLPVIRNDFYQLTDEKTNMAFHPESMFMIDNRDFRIQMDPEAELDSEVAYPTQLSYIMNLYGTNNEAADKIYQSLANIIKHNFESLQQWMAPKKFVHVMEDFLKKTNQENLKELLSEGIDPNFPAISDKLLIHYLSTIFDRAVKTKFSGTKLVLQSALGAQKAFESTNVALEPHLKRELEVKRDSEGNLYYEMIVPRGFLNKEIEDRIQSQLDAGKEPETLYYNGKKKSLDLVAFRIPSSELHSAVAVKIVGFYDNNRTNVVIAPKLLVVLHGSDFDIDALFTIKRSYVEGYASKLPVGYEEKNGRLVFNDDATFIDKIDDPRMRRKVNEAFYLNRIIEQYIGAISSEKNIQRMIDPIYLGELQEEKERMQKLTGSANISLDISSSIDKQKIHDTIFSGEAGIGMIMSMFKAFAFMHRAHQGQKITSFKKEIKTEDGVKPGYSIKFGRKSYNEMVDVDSDGNTSGYRFDSLGNAALDNFKEMILPYLNLGKETIRAYTVLVMHGVPFKTINNFISQPILRYATKYGRRDVGTLDRKIEQNVNSDDVSNVNLSDKSMEEYLKYTPEDIKKIVEKDKLDENDVKFLTYQAAVYDQYKNITKIGEEISKLNTLINTIRSYPITIAEMEDILANARHIFGIKEGESVVENTASDTDSSFPYYMDEFFTTNPHIREALKVMEWTVNKTTGEFALYSKTFRHVANKIVKDTKIKIDRTDELSKKKIREEFVKFLMTTFVNRDNIKPIPAVGRKGKKITLTGINAFNKKFVDLILTAQSYDHTLIQKSRLEGDEVPYQGNMFLNSISVRTNPFTRKERIIFNGPASMDSRDYNLYRQSFENLNSFDFDYIDGKWQLNELPTTDANGYTAFQKMFVDYAIVNYGMSFGLRNYSKVLPGRLYKELSDKIVLQMRTIENLNEDQLNNLIAAFKNQLVLNYPEGIKDRVVAGKGTIKWSREITDPETKEKKTLYSGDIEGTHFDRLFQSETSRSWPEFHVEKWNEDYTVYKRISGAEGTSGFYVRLGHKHSDPVYDLHSLEDGTNYNEKERFNQKHNGKQVRMVKGVVVGGFYENKYDELEKGQIISVTDFTDPGNLYPRVYRVEAVYGTEMYEVKELVNFKPAAYYDFQNQEVRKAYNMLESSLRKRKDIIHVFNDRLIIKKQELGHARTLYHGINKDQFNSLRVLYEITTSRGTEIKIDADLLGKFLYGRQLDIFSKGYDIIRDLGDVSDITKGKEWNDLTNRLFTLKNKQSDMIDKIAATYESKSIDQILDDISQRSTSKFQKMMASWINNTLKGTEIQFGGHADLPGDRIGEYDSDGKITLDYRKIALEGYDIHEIDRMLMHEMVHGISTYQLQVDQAFENEVKKWMEQVKDLSKDYPYAFTKPGEFISEFFSNEKFYNALSNIKTTGEKRTLGQRILDWFRKLLGIEQSFADRFEKWYAGNMKTMNEVLDNLETDEDGNYYYKKEKIDLKSIEASGYVDMSKTKFLSKIIDDNIDITIQTDERGEELDSYKIGSGKVLRRISDIYSGWTSNFRKNGKHETYGERMANEQWFNTDRNVKKKVDDIAEEVTYDEYKKLMDTRMIESEVRGRIIHLLNKLITDRLYNNARNEATIKSQIQGIAYKTYVVTDSKGIKTDIPISYDADKLMWYLDKKTEIYHNHGINVFDDIPSDMKDIIASEVTIGLEELGFAGTADMIIEHTDGTLTIKDMATGTNFDRFISSRLLKYGDQNRQIKDSPRDRKKMQIMMYALMIKAQNPDVKFKDLSVMWVPNQYQATSYDNIRKVDVEDFLAMIEAFLKDKAALKEAGIDENIYNTLKDKSPKLFDSSEYTYEYNDYVRSNNNEAESIQNRIMTELQTQDKDPVKLAERYLMELTRLIGKTPVDIKKGKNEYEKLSKMDQIRAVNLTNRILQLTQDPNISMNINPQLDVSAISGWIGNYSELSVPQIQMWKKFRDIQAQKANEEFLRKDIIHKSLLRKVLDEYYKNHPVLNKKYMNFANYKKIYGFMYKEFDNQGSKQLRFKIEDDPEWKELTDAQKVYLTFLNDHYASYFVGKDAYINQIATYVPAPGGSFKSISNLDWYNKELPEGQKFHYYRGWFPKAHKEESEMLYEYGEGSYVKGLLSKEYWKDMWVDSVTFFRENNYQGRTHATMVLPLKNMGSFRIDNARAYTYNAEFQFDQFTHGIEYKKAMDPVYALGEGVRAFLDMQLDGDQPIYANSVKMFEKKLTSDVLGRTIRHSLTRKPIRLPFNFYGSNDDMEIRSDALFMLLKGWTSATLMWLKPFTGGGNGLNATLLSRKDSIKGSIGSIKFFGIEGDAIDYTMKDQLFADKIMTSEFIVNSMLGKMEQDKTWLLAKRLKFMPDNFDYRSNDKYLLSTRNRVVSQSSLYAFHTIPEEFVSMQTMIAALNHMKHPDGRSLWDCYEVKQMPNGEYDLVWTGGSRGKLRVGKGEMTTYQDITELLPQEISKLKKVYERMQGGYRKEEAAAIEVYVLGKLFMNLKKYYPRVLLNAFASRRKELDLGYLKKMHEQVEGQDVYEWYQRWNEGRFALIGKLALSTMMMGRGNQDYKWHNLPPELRLHVIDAGITLGMFGAAYVAYLRMFGDDKDDDSMKQWWKMYMMDNFVQQYSPVELMKIGVQGLQPVAFTRSLQTVQSMMQMIAATWQLSFGDPEKAFTQEGDFRGWNNFRKAIPFASSYYDFARRIENNQTLTDIFQWEQFSKWR